MMTSREMTLNYHTKPLWQYIQEKIEMLREEFKINLSSREIHEMMQCTSEIAVDNYAHSIIMKKL